MPSTTHAASPVARLRNSAATLVRRFLERIVVPVTSTDEMNEVWKLYRLTSSGDSVRPAVARELPAGASR